MTWLRSEAEGASALDRTFGLRPNAYARFREGAKLGKVVLVNG